MDINKMHHHISVAVGILLIVSLPSGSASSQDIWPPEESIAADGFRIDTMTVHRFRNDNWEDSKLEQYLYDDNENLVRKEFFSENNGEWRLTRRETYTTDNGNIVSILKEDKRVNVFHAAEQRSFRYVDGRLT
ncbi:MAG: hypothetical protein HKN43_07960, partial [Rhodothermales bacterium]|nr:hypothetical protein [Rhodothermales bacterium]